MQGIKLWTRDFTILTIGSAVSMLGNAVSTFAISLLVLDKTGSIFLYTLFLAAYNLPKILLPLLAGPYLDMRSRKRAVYTLDFTSAALFLSMFLIVKGGLFSYPVFLSLCIIIGVIDSVYLVAYDSLFPMLVSEGNFSKAYSVSSLLYPLAYLTVPIAARIYETVGLAPLFLFNALSFLVAALCETRINVDETHISLSESRPSLSDFKKELKSGIRYVREEKGLLVITVYFFINTFVCFGADSLWLPFFASGPSPNVMAYSYITAINVLGCLISSLVQYRFRIPASKKFAVAMCVYVASSILDGGVLFTPLLVMMFIFFIDGFISVTSYNIRLSTTQSYVPENYRGRFNGVFQMMCNLGIILGELGSGALAEIFPIRTIIVGLMILNLVSAFAVMFRNREHVKPIYNRDV